MNFLQKVLLYQGWKVRYWIAWTTTTTTLASQWGLLINIDSATGDIWKTVNGWIEDEKYGCWIQVSANNTSAEFDTAVIRTWTKTLKLSSTNTTGNALVHLGYPWNLVASISVADMYKYSIPLKASTKYRLSFYAKTTNVGASWVYSYITTYNTSWTRVQLLASNKLSGTNDWTRLVTNFTSAASDAFCSIALRNEIAGTISDAWFDINSMTLEEVVEPVANSLTSSSPSLVSFTAVGSTDNIDQSQLTQNTQLWVWSWAWVQVRRSQSFTPTKSKHTWVVLYKWTNTWTPTGNFKVDVVTNNAGSPSTTILATQTIALATYNALALWEFTVNLPCNLTAWTLYHYVISNTATEAWTNNFGILANSAWGYTWGDQRTSLDWAAWTVTWTNDLYFKTLYYKPTTNFKASQNNLEVDISADEEWFIENSVLGITTWTWSFTDPITSWQIQNNMYFSRSTWCTVTASNTVQFSWAWQNYILKVNLWLVGSWDMTYTLWFATNNTISYSYDNIAAYTSVGTLVWAWWSVTIPMNWYSTVYIKNNANAAWSITNHSWTCPVTTSWLSVLKNYPTNKDIIKQYSTTLGSATTSATYRATKWGFPAIEYSATEYKFLDVDTTATGSTVAFSELWTSYTTVADWASLAITSTSTPNLFVKANITANRLFVSSNDYVASSDKDWSLRQSIVYQVVQ